MKGIAIQIRRDDVTRDIRMLADRLGVSITDAVAEAVKAKLADEEVKQRKALEERRRKSREILEELWALPVVGRILTDKDLYDEDGLPKSVCD